MLTNSGPLYYARNSLREDPWIYLSLDIPVKKIYLLKCFFFKPCAFFKT